jgi:hypothetical protein
MEYRCGYWESLKCCPYSLHYIVIRADEVESWTLVIEYPVYVLDNTVIINGDGKGGWITFGMVGILG